MEDKGSERRRKIGGYTTKEDTTKIFEYISMTIQYATGGLRRSSRTRYYIPRLEYPFKSRKEDIKSKLNTRQRTIKKEGMMMHSQVFEISQQTKGSSQQIEEVKERALSRKKEKKRGIAQKKNTSHPHQ